MTFLEVRLSLIYIEEKEWRRLAWLDAECGEGMTTGWDPYPTWSCIPYFAAYYTMMSMMPAGVFLETLAGSEQTFNALAAPSRS